MKERIAFGVAFAALCALLVASVAAPSFLPTNDGPHHVFGAFARAHIDDPTLGYARFFVPNVPPSANGFAEVFALLEPSLGWRAAHQATLGVIVLVWALGALAFTTAVDPRRRWLALLAATLGVGWPLYLGFFSFVLSGGLALLVVAAAMKVPFTPTARVVLAAALLVTAAVHFLMAAQAGLLLVVVRLSAVDRSARLRELGLVALMGVPAMILVSRLAGTTEHLADGTTVVPWSIRLEALGACTLGGPAWRQAIVVVAVLASVACLAVRGRRLVERALVATAALLCITPLWLPWDVLGWQYAAARPLPVAACVLVALLPVERLARRGQLVVAAVSIALSFAATAWALSLGERAAHEVDDVLRATRTPAAPGYRWAFFTAPLPVEEDAGLLRWDPQRGLGSLFGVTAGGFVAYSHVVSPQAHTVLLRDDVAAALAPPPVRSREVSPLRAIDDDAKRLPLVEALASKAVQVDGVILAERPADHAVWKARGYDVDLEDGRVLLAHFTGCSARVITGEARRVGTAPGPSIPGVLVRTDEVPAGGALLERLPCGVVDVMGCGETKSATLTRGAPVEIVCR